jgi:hypothetical protein
LSKHSAKLPRPYILGDETTQLDDVMQWQWAEIESNALAPVHLKLSPQSLPNRVFVQFVT